MYPILVEFEWFGYPLSLRAYSAAMVSAVVTIALLGVFLGWKRRLPLACSAAFVLLVAVVLPLGSRISYWLLSRESAADVPELLVPRSGLSGFFLPGGIMAAALLGALACRPLRLPAWCTFDTLVPALGAAGVVQRIGCFLNGCCFGRETSLPWGVVYPWGSPVHSYQASESFFVILHGPAPVHPTQLYEAAACVVAAGVALLLMRHRATDGVPVLAALVWFLAFRWFNSTLRAPDPAFPPVAARSAAIYGTGLLVAIAALVRRLRVDAKPAGRSAIECPTSANQSLAE